MLSSSCRVWQVADLTVCLLQNTLYELSLGRPEHVEHEEEVCAGLAHCVRNLPAMSNSAATAHGRIPPFRKNLQPLLPGCLQEHKLAKPDIADGDQD